LDERNSEKDCPALMSGRPKIVELLRPRHSLHRALTLAEAKRENLSG
jgi:hypothetical protein